jgi:hypothetical protein
MSVDVFVVHTVAVGTYPIQISFTGDTNFSPMYNSSAYLLIIPASTAFSSLTPSQTIPAGTQYTHFYGTVLESKGIVPTGTVEVIINGVASNPVPLVGGSFQLDYYSLTLPPSSAPYPILYYYSGDANYGALDDESTALTVTQPITTPQFYGLTTMPAIMEYGNSNVVLAGAVSVQPQNGTALQLTQSGDSNSSAVTLPYNANPPVSTIGAVYDLWVKTTAKNAQMLFHSSYAYSVMNGYNSDQYVLQRFFSDYQSGGQRGSKCHNYNRHDWHQRYDEDNAIVRYRWSGARWAYLQTQTPPHVAGGSDICRVHCCWRVRRRRRT